MNAQSALAPEDPGINDRPVFAAELVPYRSLRPAGFRILMMATGGICMLHSAFFWVTGAWMASLFFGLDFLLLYGAFRLNYRAARAREEVTVSRTLLEIRKFSPAGKLTRHRFNPFFARFNVERHEEFGILSMAISGEGRHTTIGAFLNPDDRESFANALTAALAGINRRL